MPACYFPPAKGLKTLGMDGYESSSYGDRIADVYDQWYQTYRDTETEVDFLAALAGTGGRALELGIGTGRIALPLAERGVAVEGIEVSNAMLSKLRAYPGGRDIPVTVGDFADVDVTGEFQLIYVAFNTLFYLTTQSEQIRCLKNVAAHMECDGWFVMDTVVPELEQFRSGQTTRVLHVDADTAVVSLRNHDGVGQTIEEMVVEFSSRGVRTVPSFRRYAWPAEIDAMAHAAGLVLADRYEDYSRQPFTTSSPAHVSVFQRMR